MQFDIKLSKNLSLSKLFTYVDKLESQLDKEDLYKIQQLKQPERYLQSLSYWSTLFDNSVIIELGTLLGVSALCLSFNETNNVISHDIVDKQQSLIEKSNLKFKIKNVFDDEEYMKTFLNSPFIFIDVQHDGPEENLLLDFLIDNKYKGVTLWDDIYLNEPMDKFWKRAANIKGPYNLHDLSVCRNVGLGWGVIDFSKELTII